VCIRAGAIATHLASERKPPHDARGVYLIEVLLLLRLRCVTCALRDLKLLSL